MHSNTLSAIAPISMRLICLGVCVCSRTCACVRACVSVAGVPWCVADSSAGSGVRRGEDIVRFITGNSCRPVQSGNASSSFDACGTRLNNRGTYTFLLLPCCRRLIVELFLGGVGGCVRFAPLLWTVSSVSFASTACVSVLYCFQRTVNYIVRSIQ